MNFKNLHDRAELIHRLKENTTEVPCPRLSSPCLIPNTRIEPDGTIVNRYLSLRVNGVSIPRHVVAAAIKFGEAPRDGKYVLHQCDRKACCQPDHMELGSATDNAKEAVERGRVARGVRHGAYTKPDSRPRGEKHRFAKISDVTAAGIKWCLANPHLWFTKAIQGHYDEVSAIAIHFGVSAPMVRQIKSGKSWVAIDPAQPPELPFAKTPPGDQEVPKPLQKSILTAEAVREIRAGYYDAFNPRHFVRDTAIRYGVSTVTIWHVLKRKTWRHVAPEIPAVLEAGHGMAEMTVREVQQVRATEARYASTIPIKGLTAALARHFERSISHIRNIIEGVVWIDVEPDSHAFIPLEDLEFKPQTQRGADHKLAKLNDEKVFEILLRLENGEKKAALAREFGVSINLIYNIGAGRTWRHVFDLYRSQRAKGHAGNGAEGTQS